MIKSFKQYITETSSEYKEAYPGVYYSGYDVVGLSEEMVNWLVDHTGISVTDKDNKKIYINEEYRTNKIPFNRESPQKDYYLLNIRNFIAHLLDQKVMFDDTNNTMKVEAYRFMLPENRKKVMEILKKVMNDTTLELDDSKIKKALHIKNDKELYHWEKDITNKPGKPNKPDEDNYSKYKYDL